MKTIAPSISVILLTVSAASAHEAVVNHAHPHGDWNLSLAAVILAAAGIGWMAFKRDK